MTTDTQRVVNPVRIFISGACAGLAQVRDSLAASPEIEFLGSANDVAKASQKIRANGTQVILHAVGVVDELPSDDIESLREQSAAPIILLVNEMSQQLLAGALELGVSDVILLPQLTENIVFAIKKAYSLGQLTVRDARASVDSKVITVFSAKGGSGKTTLVTNLAAHFARSLGQKTLLLDLDLQFGDVAIMLGTEPRRTILDLVMAHGELDPDKLQGYVSRHESGLEVLPAPLRPEDAELISDDRLGNLIDVAKRTYDIILIDTPTIFNSSVLTALDRTDSLLVVASMEIPALKSTRVCLQTLDMLNFPKERSFVVMNRARTKVGLRQGEIEQVIERKVAFEVPSSRSVPVAINKGVPVVMAEPRSDVGQAISRICKALAPGAQVREESGKRGLFGRRKKGAQPAAEQLALTEEAPEAPTVVEAPPDRLPQAGESAA